MTPLPSRSLVMSTNVVLEARLDMLSLAIECVGATLSAAQPREVALAFSDKLSLLLTQRGQVSDAVDAVLACQAGLLTQAFRR
jgi:hypothetical protein